MKKYRSERKGRRTLDTAPPYNTLDMITTEKTRTAIRSGRALTDNTMDMLATEKTRTAKAAAPRTCTAPRSMRGTSSLSAGGSGKGIEKCSPG